MTHECGADTLALVLIDHWESYLGFAGLQDDVATTADDHGAAFSSVRQHPRHNRTDPTQQMASRNTPLKIAKIEQLAPIARLPTHRGRLPPPNPSSRRNHRSPKIASAFSTPSAQLQSSDLLQQCRAPPRTGDRPHARIPQLKEPPLGR
jgi:hypothetical protein